MTTARIVRFVLAAALLAAVGCARPAPLFVDEHARAHVSMLAGTIGSRPVGTEENARARAYIVDQLKSLGFSVRVQSMDASRPEHGLTARVANIIGVLPGEREEALGLLAHYDSSPDAPGATDDALGVAVVLEAARVFAAAPDRRWTLYALITDGEEAGLLGAAGLVTDREVMSRLKAYVNVESIGSAGPAVLFQTGPGNAWLTGAWAGRAAHPRGGSYAIEVYRRLPNDTDFTVLEAEGVPGLNLAPIGDSYAYHTARDTPERLSRQTIRTTGEAVASLVRALQAVDITRRSDETAVYFDIGGTAAVSYGRTTGWLVSALALGLGIVALVRVSRAVIAAGGAWRWMSGFLWAVAGFGGALAAMVAATWALRAASAVYHPWYAHPVRLFALLIVTGALAAWVVARAGRWLPAGARPARRPAVAWSVALPVWLLAAAAALWAMPAAAYLWTVPLLTAGLLLSIVPPRNDIAVRSASVAILAVCATLWAREIRDLLLFTVALMARQPVITPVPAYAVLLGAGALMLAPPLVAALVSARPVRRPWLLTALLLLATAGTGLAAYHAQAYTDERPLRRTIRVLQDEGASPATVWEVGSHEPGLDLAPDAPPGWTPVSSRHPARVPWGAVRHPFAFRMEGLPLGPAPASVGGVSIAPLGDGTFRLNVSVVPQEPGLHVRFVLPPGLTPLRTSLPGVAHGGRWIATFVAPPAEGIAWEAVLPAEAAGRTGEVLVAVTSSRFPGGAGWQRLPPWLPQDLAVWSGAATWVLATPPTLVPPALLGIAPVPPLR